MTVTVHDSDIRIIVRGWKPRTVRSKTSLLLPAGRRITSLSERWTVTYDRTQSRTAI